MERFQRNINPKAAMKTGGVNFGEEFNIFFKNWQHYIKSSVEGKTITGIMIKKWRDKNGTVKQKNSSMLTVKVKRIEIIELIDLYSFKLRFIGEDDAQYNLKLNQDIIIE